MSAVRPRRGGVDEGAGNGREAASIVPPASLFAMERTAYGTEIRYEVGADRPQAAETTAAMATGHQRMANTVGAESWLKLAAAWVDAMIGRGLTIDADRMQAAIGTPPTAGLPAVALRRAKLAGKIQVVGFRTSERPQARGHAIREWGPQ